MLDYFMFASKVTQIYLKFKMCLGFNAFFFVFFCFYTTKSSYIGAFAFDVVEGVVAVLSVWAALASYWAPCGA